MNEERRARTITIVLVATSAIVALVLRVAGTGVRTMTWDEAYHLRLVAEPTVDAMLGAILANPPSDPLYALLLRAWTELGATSDALARLPSAVFGAATTIAVAWLGWELTADRRVVIGSAALVAIAPYAVEFGQEATLYSLATLTTTLALAAGWRWLRTARPRIGVLAVILAVVAVYSHYVAAAVLGVAALLAVSRLGGPRRVDGRALAIAGTVVVIAWLPWLVPMLGSWAGGEATRTALPVRAGPLELAGALSQYTSGTAALLEGVRPLQLAGVVLAAILVARAWLIGRDPGLRGLRVVLVTAAVLFLGPWLFSVLVGRWTFVAHLMLFMLPALAVVLVAGGVVAEPGGRKLWRTAGAMALGGLLVVQAAGLVVDALHPPHGDDGVRRLVDTMTAQVTTSEPVLVAPPGLAIVIARYWPTDLHGLPADVDLRALYRQPLPGSELAVDIARFESLTRGADRAWLIYTPAREADASFLTWLGRRATVVRRSSGQFADLYEVQLTPSHPN